MQSNTRQRALLRAVDILGSQAALAQHLGVGDHSLGIWLQGRARIPDSIFCVAVDLIVDDDIKRAGQDRRCQPRGSIVASPSAELAAKSA